MANELIELPREEVIENGKNSLWSTNEGIYLGCMVDAPNASAHFPLEIAHRLESVPSDQPIKSWWRTNGGIVRFIGERHIFTVGANGSGKTRKLLLPNLFRLKDWSCVVMDTKGELCAHSAVHRSQREGHKVYVIDPFGVMEKNYPLLYAQHPDLFKSHGCNVLANVDPASPSLRSSFVDDISKIASALVKNDNARDPYWTMAAQALIEGILTGLKVEYGAAANLNHLRQVLATTPENLAKNYINPTIENFGKKYPELVASLGEFTHFSPEDRELSGIRRTAKTHTKWLDSKPMQSALAGGMIDAADMKKTPTTIYLILPPDQLTDKSVWLRLMITSLLMPLMRSVEDSRVPVLFMLDEVAALGHMQIFQDNYAMLRGFGVKFWTIWQGIGQASNLYGDWWETFVGQAGAVQSFGLGTDLQTREYFSRFNGDRLQTRITYNRTKSENSGWGQNSGSSGALLNIGSNFSEGSSSSESWGEQHGMERSLKPHELAALDSDETILFDRRGKLHLAVCPQPQYLGGKMRDALLNARDAIEGRRISAA